jgi:hypothetical protein
VHHHGAASTTPDTPPVIHIGDTYADLGATITGPQADLNLGIRSTLVSNIVIDTSVVATDTIDYVASNNADLTSTSTRTVTIQTADVPSIVPADYASTTAATSTAQ